jgi:hypothetical protein
MDANSIVNSVFFLGLNFWFTENLCMYLKLLIVVTVHNKIT